MDIQKAKHLFLEMDKKKPDINSAYMVFEKHDGWYGYLDFPSCTIMSRAKREIPALKELSDLIRSKRPNIRGRLIFEIMIEGLEIDSFHELNGILNRKYEQAEDVYLQVHDFVPDFQRCTMPFTKRYEFAGEIVRNMNLPSVRLSPSLGISSLPSEWYRLAATVQSRGGEGVILKDIASLYKGGKRISTLMKIKEEVTAELLCIDVIEGQGEHTGQAGKLVCESASGMRHEVGMGYMKHDERINILRDKSLIKGKVVECKAMKKLADGKYREMRFKAIRYDKRTSEID